MFSLMKIVAVSSANLKREEKKLLLCWGLCGKMWLTFCCCSDHHSSKQCRVADLARQDNTLWHSSRDLVLFEQSPSHSSNQSLHASGHVNRQFQTPFDLTTVCTACHIPSTWLMFWFRREFFHSTIIILCKSQFSLLIMEHYFAVNKILLTIKTCCVKVILSIMSLAFKTN